MSNSALLNRDALLRSLQDMLGELADKMGSLPPECKECPVYTTLSEFAVRLRKAGLQEEAEIIRNVREFYNI